MVRKISKFCVLGVGMFCEDGLGLSKVWVALKTVSLDLILRAMCIGFDVQDRGKTSQTYFQWLPGCPGERWIERIRLEAGSLIRKLLIGERTDMLQNKLKDQRQDLTAPWKLRGIKFIH